LENDFRNAGIVSSAQRDETKVTGLALWLTYRRTAGQLGWRPAFRRCFDPLGIKLAMLRRVECQTSEFPFAKVQQFSLLAV
jgi:hypothetical protein